MTEYRIRWSVITVGNGYRLYRERRCIAERRVMLFWLLPIWSPLFGADWRATEEQALRDVEYDRQLRSPLPDPKAV